MGKGEGREGELRREGKGEKGKDEKRKVVKAMIETEKRRRGKRKEE